MARSHLVLDLVEKRVQLQEQLKASLKRQQDMLVTNQLANLNDISGEQIAILEAFQEYETAYRKQLSSYFSDEELANPPLPLSQRLGLSGAEAKSLLRWQEQLRGLLTEITELRKANFMLMGHSLNFIRELFKQLATGGDSGAVYRKDKKTTSSTVLINRTV